MKLFSTALLVLSVSFLSACSTPKYKAYSGAADFKTAGNLIKGKTPKEAVAIAGKPMSAYFDSDKNVYFLVYPQNDSEISLTDLMFNDRLECLAFNFEREKQFKFDGWQSPVSFTCQAIKGQKLDTSLID